MNWINCLRVAVASACLATASTAATPRTELPPRQAPALQVTGPALIAATTGVSSSHVFDVRYTGVGGHLDVSHTVQGLEPAPLVQTLGGGRFRVTFRTGDAVPEGLTRGMLTMRMCTEAPCQNPIPGASSRAQLWVRTTWADGPDWASYQGNASHDGHVGIAVNPRDIARAWTRDAGPSASFPALDQVATSGRLGFIPMQRASGHAFMAFDLRTGSTVWTQAMPSSYAINPAATSAGRVYFTTTGFQQTFLWSFDADDGAPRSQSAFSMQIGRVLAPTIANGLAYVNGGYFDRGVYAFDADDGLPLWSAFSAESDETTPAVRDGRVYYYDGARLKVYEAFDGTDLLTIEDPLQPQFGGSYRAAPMLGSPDHVIAPSGVNYVNPRRLVNFAPSNAAPRWVSVRAYGSAPAVSDGVIYATSNNPKSFDAIDEASGALIASWVPGVADTSFVGNVVLTRNLAFVSTTVATYAIDRATHLPVWSTPIVGTLSISGTGMLLIVENTRNFPQPAVSRIHGFSLRSRTSRTGK